MREVFKMKMSALTVARYFLSRSIPNTDESITHLKLQKLVYYAQAWHLALRGEKLFEERIEAWVHGPVCPDLYQEYREFGYQEIPIVDIVKINDESIEELLEAVWVAYGKFDGKFLEELTHQETPWLQARSNLSDQSYSNNVITSKSME